MNRIFREIESFLPIIIYKVLKRAMALVFGFISFLPIIIYKVLKLLNW